EGGGEKIRVFTTRVDTIFGATSVQLAPEHPLVPMLTANDADLELQISAMIDEQKVARETDNLGGLDKQGIFLGRYAINPYSHARVPIWVANYVLMEYGTGAIMSVPGHDERDFEFATKYGLEIRRVIRPAVETEESAALPFISEEGLLVNSGEFDGLRCEQAQSALQIEAKAGGVGEAKITFRLRDWGV